MPPCSKVPESPLHTWPIVLLVGANLQLVVFVPRRLPGELVYLGERHRAVLEPDAAHDPEPGGEKSWLSSSHFIRLIGN